MYLARKLLHACMFAKYMFACAQHSKLALAAATGQGSDRHLFALRAIAVENCAQGIAPTLPQLFRDASFALLAHNTLSTSHLTRPSIDINGFGPVVEDGYGIAYNIRSDEVRGAVTTYLGTEQEFVANMHIALKYIGTLLRVLESGRGSSNRSQNKN